MNEIRIIYIMELLAVRVARRPNEESVEMSSWIAVRSNRELINTPSFWPLRRARPAVRFDWRRACMRFVFTSASFVFAVVSATAEEITCDAYSFTQAPFVSPRIIQDLETWISDGGEQVVAINLPESAGTNRYFGNVTIEQPNTNLPPTVVYEDEDACEDQSCPFGPPYFAYQMIGQTPTGVYVVRTTSVLGGSGIFESLLLVTVISDQGFSYDKDSRSLIAGRERCLIKRMEEIPLGDRYSGAVSLDGDVLHIGSDSNPRGAGLFPDDVAMTVPAPPEANLSDRGMQDADHESVSQ